ncbi:sensor histidine kinase [Amycolatopsis azurea]|uniref:sensor histidine kinase n=1 Tax=Amycolatopsis azurea TaxID=36819 RepID=UPI00381F8C69
MTAARRRQGALPRRRHTSPTRSTTLARTAATAAMATLMVTVPTLWPLVEKGRTGAAIQAGLLLVVATALLCLGIAFRTRSVRDHPGAVLVMLAIEAAVTLPPHLWIGVPWQGADLILGWLVLILLRPPWSWLVFLAVVCRAVLDWVSPSSAGSLLAGVLMLLSGLLLQCLLRIGDLADKLARARTSLATLAAADARAEMSRDLHDSLGQSLVSIALRAQLADRVATKDIAATRHELLEIHRMAEEALADMRAVAHGTRRPTFTEELPGAVGLLEAIGARCELRTEHAPPPGTEAVLGWVLREAVTNIVRHSDPTACVITTHQRGGAFTLQVGNNGVIAKSPSTRGQGLDGLSTRVHEYGGSLSTELEDGRFTLTVTVPGTGCGRPTDSVCELEDALS